MDYQNIVIHDEGPVRVIEMNRPDRRNALSEAHLRELHAAFSEVEGSKAKGVILAARVPCSRLVMTFRRCLIAI